MRSDGNGNGKDVTIPAQMSPLSEKCFIELICETTNTVVTDTYSLLVTARLFCRTDD